MDPLPIELEHVSFSRAGSWLCLTARNEAQVRANPHLHIRPGLWLRNFHDEGRRDVFLLEPVVDGVPVSYEAEATPAELRLRCAAGIVRLCIAGSESLRIRTEGVGLRLAMLAGLSGGEFPLGEGVTRINAAGTLHDYTVQRLAGGVTVARTDLEGKKHVTGEMPPHGGNAGKALLVQRKGQPELNTTPPPFDACVEMVDRDFTAFHETQARVPARLATPAYLATYINWSSYVAPCGHYRRPAMLMSKNWMGNVWSWDHCFTAIGLAETAPAMAWDQFMVMFDHQQPTGQLPDTINDTVLQYNNLKPPIHGWTYRCLMRLNDWFAAPARLEAVYPRLASWTEWWYKHRDPKGTGLPEYHHGNDSGWDNGTVFDVGLPTRGPDLATFLVLQLDLLADLADRLKRPDAAAAWRTRADATLHAMLAELWEGDRFVTRHAATGACNTKSKSIINCVPAMIADRLPKDVREAVLARLRENLTDWGLATESPDSEVYQSDGYWRGPIWASPTLLFIDGLRSAGEAELAQIIADRFLALCEKSGFAENYDALTGAPLRDRSYTWASSVFLLLARERSS
jgi:hypothetical protein